MGQGTSFPRTLKREDPIVAIEPKKDFKLQVPLGEDMDCWVYIYGGVPTRQQFNRLHEYLDLFEMSLFGKSNTHPEGRRDRRGLAKVSGGVKVVRMREVIPMEVKDQIVADYDRGQGMRQFELAEKYKKGFGTIRSILKSAGVLVKLRRDK